MVVRSEPHKFDRIILTSECHRTKSPVAITSTVIPGPRSLKMPWFSNTFPPRVRPLPWRSTSVIRILGLRRMPLGRGRSDRFRAHILYVTVAACLIAQTPNAVSKMHANNATIVLRTSS